MTILVSLSTLAFLMLAATGWLGSKASHISRELSAATQLVPVLKEQLSGSNTSAAAATISELRAHTAAAKRAADDPLWALSSTLPGLGANFSAITEVTRSADDVANLGLAPLIDVYSSLNWEGLLPTRLGADLEPLAAAAPSMASAANAVRLSADRMNQIDASALLPQVAQPLVRAREELQEVTSALDSAASAATLIPPMMGAEAPRKYLLMIQNNAEARASGGIPGALAVLTVDDGKMTLNDQTSAGQIGRVLPAIPLDPTQEQIYSPSMGEVMQDVNMSPDFPSTARTALAIWERWSGNRLDGVVSVDPIALSYVLDASGPVDLSGSELSAIEKGSLPVQLSGKNVVHTLLSGVYDQIRNPVAQDAYFALAAQEIFQGISSGNVPPNKLVPALVRGADERRILVWSQRPEEQTTLAKYALSGSISGPSVGPAQFGVYFNDGTGAKMDYYVKRTAQLIEQCGTGGYREVKVRVTSTNTAPDDASTSLPPYVTGNGVFGVPPGSVQTNVVAYGPVQSNVTTTFVDGAPKPFAAQRHDGRPVGTLTTRLAPGQSSTIEFTFARIVQQAELMLTVTPTVQPTKEVVLTTSGVSCNPAE